MYYQVLEKKKLEFLFFLNDADMENYGTSRNFGYIYIYILYYYMYKKLIKKKKATLYTLKK